MPAKAGTLALTSDIPTAVSDLTNDSGFQTSTQVDAAIGYATSDMMTTDTAQTVTGTKTFTSPVNITADSNNNNNLIFSRTNSSTGVVSEDINFIVCGIVFFGEVVITFCGIVVLIIFEIDVSGDVVLIVFKRVVSVNIVVKILGTVFFGNVLNLF